MRANRFQLQHGPAPLNGAPCTLAACRSLRARSAARAHCVFFAYCRSAATSCRPDSCWCLARRDADHEPRHVRPNFGHCADSQRGSLEPGSRMRTTRRSVRPIRTATLHIWRFCTPAERRNVRLCHPINFGSSRMLAACGWCFLRLQSSGAHAYGVWVAPQAQHAVHAYRADI